MVFSCRHYDSIRSGVGIGLHRRLVDGRHYRRDGVGGDGCCCCCFTLRRRTSKEAEEDELDAFFECLIEIIRR